MYLVDTNVISDIRKVTRGTCDPSRPKPDAAH